MGLNIQDLTISSPAFDNGDHIIEQNRLVGVYEN